MQISGSHPSRTGFEPATDCRDLLVHLVRKDTTDLWVKMESLVIRDAMDHQAHKVSKAIQEAKVKKVRKENQEKTVNVVVLVTEDLMGRWDLKDPKVFVVNQDREAIAVLKVLEDHQAIQDYQVKLVLKDSKENQAETVKQGHVEDQVPRDPKAKLDRQVVLELMVFAAIQENQVHVDCEDPTDFRAHVVPLASLVRLV